MRRLCLAMLGSWMALAAAFAQEDGPLRPSDAQPVRIQFTHMGSFNDEGAKVGEEVFAPPSLVRRWGWEVTTRYSDADITIDSRTLRVAMVVVRGRPMVSLSDAARAAGAKTEWSKDGRTYFMRSSVRNIELTSTGIRIDGTLPLKAKVFRIASPDRLVIDLEGADLNPAAGEGLPQGWRAGQLNEGTVRVVVEHPQMARQGTPALPTGRTLTLALMSVDPAAAPIATGPSPQPSQNPKPAAQPGKNPPALLAGLAGLGETPQEARLIIPGTKGRAGAPVGAYLNSRKIRIRIPNSRIAASEALNGAEGSLFSSAVLASSSGGATELVVDTVRPLGFEATSSPDGVQVRLFVPPAADGLLSGKTIVIDPGHGGDDPGATAGGANEKNIVLPVSRMVAQELEAAGVRVILTRSTDVFIPLNRRAAIANEARADLFVSIHVNSNTVANTASGSKMFYHRSQSLGMLLATLMDEEFKTIGRVPSMGTWSDTRIYKSGFAVLRQSQMPGVLVETGFINHSRDRAALVTEAHQKAMASAIVRAIRSYIGEAPTP